MAPEAPAAAPRRTAPTPKYRAMPPEEFFSRIIQGLLQSEGQPGVFGGDAVEMFANPENAVRWYGAYLVLCSNWDAVVTGRTKVNLSGMPPAVQAVMKDLLEG